MKFHITIKDNETGETLRDIDTNAIIGGVVKEEGSETILIAKCNDYDLAKAVIATEMGTKHVKRQKGLLFRLLLADMTEGTTTEVKDLSDKQDESPTDKEGTEQ